MMKLYKNIIYLLVIATIILSGCASMQTRWESAKTENTVDAYNKFIKKYPESAFYRDAVTRIVQLIISEKYTYFSEYSEPGETLERLGSVAIEELFASLTDADLVERASIASALAFLNDISPELLDNKKTELEPAKEIAEQDVDSLIDLVKTIIFPFEYQDIIKSPAPELQIPTPNIKEYLREMVFVRQDGTLPFGTALERIERKIKLNGDSIIIEKEYYKGDPKPTKVRIVFSDPSTMLIAITLSEPFKRTQAHLPFFQKVGYNNIELFNYKLQEEIYLYRSDKWIIHKYSYE